MHGYPSPEILADRMRNIPVAKARQELGEILDAAWELGFGQEFAWALNFNARLVTCLRVRGVKIWGTEPTETAL